MKRVALLALLASAGWPLAEVPAHARAHEVSAATADVQHLRDAAAAARSRGDLAAAVTALEAALALRPDDVELLRLLGTAQAQRGATDAALATLARAQRLAPDDADVKLATAQVHYYRGEAAQALRLAADVLGAFPTNEDARDLVARARRAARDGAARSRVDAYASYSDFNDDARQRWLESGVAVAHRASERLSLSGRVDVAERFGRTDVALEAGVERELGAGTSASLAAGVTPGADFLPQWLVRGGLRTRLQQGDAGAGPTILTLDARYAEYRSGSVETLSPGIEQYFAQGRLWATGRLILTWDENGERQAGWLVRGDGQVDDRLRLFAGYADAPETSENVTLSTRTIFAGIVADLDDRHVLRFDYARDDRESSYVRNVFTLGLGVHF